MAGPIETKVCAICSDGSGNNNVFIIMYLFYIALNPCTVLSASQLKGVTLHH